MGHRRERGEGKALVLLAPQQVRAARENATFLPAQAVVLIEPVRLEKASEICRLIEWLELEGPLKIIQLQPPDISRDTCH